VTRLTFVVLLFLGVSGIFAQDSGNLQWGDAECFAFLETHESLVPTGFTQLAISIPTFGDTATSVDPSSGAQVLMAAGVKDWQEQWLLYLENEHCSTLWEVPPAFTYEDYEEKLLLVGIQLLVLPEETQPFMVGYNLESILDGDQTLEEIQQAVAAHYQKFTADLPLVNQLVLSQAVFFDLKSRKFLRLSSPILIRSGC
jgi:hypothetical protein